RRAARVWAARPRLPLRRLPQRARSAARAPRPRRAGNAPAPAARRRPPGARRLLDLRRPAARAARYLQRGLHHGARHRGRAAARSRGGSARLPSGARGRAGGARGGWVAGERWQELSQALEHQWWTRVVRSNSRSGRWWKRLECARFLSVAATSRDIGRVLRLLRDHHPAVQIAAATTLERLASPVLVTA